MHWTSHFCTIYKSSHNFTIKFKLLKYTTAIWCRIFAISIWLHLMKVWHDRFSTMVFRGGYKYRCELGRVYVLYSVFCRIHKMRMYLYGNVCVSLSRCVCVCLYACGCHKCGRATGEVLNDGQVLTNVWPVWRTYVSNSHAYQHGRTKAY